MERSWMAHQKQAHTTFILIVNHGKMVGLFTSGKMATVKDILPEITTNPYYTIKKV